MSKLICPHCGDATAPIPFYFNATVVLDNKRLAAFVQGYPYVSGGAQVVHHLMSYSDVQPVNHPSVHIGPLLDVFGVEVSMRQTAVAVALLNIDCEFFDAFR